MRRISERGWFALAAALRVVLSVALGGRLYQTDEVGLDGAGWLWAQAARAGRPELSAIVPPVPAAFFGSFYALFGHFPLLPRLAQALVGAATACLIGRMTTELSGSTRAGRWAVAIAAVYPFFVYYSGILMTETVYLAFVVPGIWWLASSLQDRGEGERALRRAAGAGLLLALAALCRVEAAPIVLVLLALGAVAAAFRRWSWKAWLLASLCWSLPLLGWAARNRARYGVFTLDAHGGVTLLHGTLLYDLVENLDTEDAMRALERMPFYQEAQALPPVERDRVYRRKAVEFMRDNPGETAWQWARKFKNFWRFYPRTDKAYREDAISHPGLGLGRWVLVAISLLFEPWLIVLGWLGLWGLRRRPGAWPPALFALGTMGVHILVVSMMRYRLPVMPFLILGASAWIAARQESIMTSHG